MFAVFPNNYLEQFFGKIFAVVEAVQIANELLVRHLLPNILQYNNTILCYNNNEIYAN